MIVETSPYKVFALSQGGELAKRICDYLGCTLGNIQVARFSDGEFAVSFEESVRGQSVYIVQSTCPSSDNIMELLLAIDAAKRASAYKVIAVIPYFGWARQDRKDKPRVSIGAKVCANLLQGVGVDRVITVDLHADQIQGFFDIPVDHLYGAPLLAKYFKNKMQEDWVVVSPDVGSVGRARNFASRVNASLAIVDKRRPKANAIEVMNVIGDVKDKTCIMVDDMIDTAGTICQGAQALVNNGAKEVYACCTHAVLSGPALERIAKSPIKKFLYQLYN